MSFLRLDFAKMDLFSADEQQLRRSFNCKICLEPFSKNRRYPISLNCGHTFCACCIKQLSSTGTSISCGLCRRGTYSDFRQLGKNVTLLDLLEHSNLLAEDDLNETTDDDEDNMPLNQPWRGANHFVSSSALTTFIDRNTDLRSSVRQFLSPMQWSEFDEPLDAIRCSLFTIEEQLRESGDSFIFQEAQLTQLENKFQRRMVEYYHQQQQQQVSFGGLPHNFIPVRWAVSDDSDDDINVLAMSIDTGTSNNRLFGTSNSNFSFGAGNSNNRLFGTGNSNNRLFGTGNSNFSFGNSNNRLLGTGNSNNRRGTGATKPRRSRKRTRRPNDSFGNVDFFHIEDGNNFPSSFDTWGIRGHDEWDQSAQSIHNYLLTETVPSQEIVPEEKTETTSEEKTEVSKEETVPLPLEETILEEKTLTTEKVVSEEKTEVPKEETVPLSSEKNIPEEEAEAVSPTISETPEAKLNVVSTRAISSVNRFYAQYVGGLVGSLLEEMSMKEANQFRKELNEFLETYENNLTDD